MNILDIYKKYQIMPQQVEHHFRVAGVGSIILDNLTLTPTLSQKEREEIVTACLLHDMGNIIKFDLDRPLFKESLQPQGVEYWKSVQENYWQKYGRDEYPAHLQIAREIGASQRVVELIGAISFTGAPENCASDDFGKKICQYSDDRVGPWGVVSLEGRFADLRERYKHHGENSPERDAFENALREIEKQIFAKCKIKPEEITEEKVKQKFEELRNYDI